MNPLWLSYLPYNIAADLLAHPGVSPVGREQRFPAVALFADVSGFVRLSEALSKHGTAGAEELTVVLNRYFSAMIELIASYGGIVGKFGGDSLSVLFPYTRRNRLSAACRAVRCALDMQARMPDYGTIATSSGTFSLTMRAGLALGEALCTVVGDPERRLEYIIAGTLLDRAAEAEGYARPGEVVVHHALFELLQRGGDLAQAEPVRSAGDAPPYQRVRRLRRPVPKQPLPPLPMINYAASRGLLVAFHHPAIARYLGRAQRFFVTEHRKVTVLFVRFPDFDYDHDPRVSSRLQSYLSAAMRIIDRYDGYLRQVEMGDKGSKYIVLFGAPLSHEDDAERALRCALELREVEHLPTQIGVDTGYTFCGLIGCAARQEYAVVGDAVNMAARLMEAAAHHQIVVSNRTRHDAGAGFAWEPHEPISAKGRATLVTVSVLAGLANRPALRLPASGYSLPMVGRASELRQIDAALEQVLGEAGQVIGLAAEAGMGKSRLVSEAMRLAADRGLHCLSGECLSYGTHAGYLVWRRILGELVGIDSQAGAETGIQRLERCLATLDAAFVQLMPLLSVVLNLPIADNELTRTFDPQARKNALETLVVDTIRRRAAEQPLILVLENCHWIDPLSYDLLEAVTRGIVASRVLLLLAYRPREVPGGELRLRHLPHVAELRLAELSRDQVETLIRLKLVRLAEEQRPANGEARGQGGLLKARSASEAVSPELIARIAEQAQGNPLYVDEVIELIYERGLDPASPQALRALRFPDSLHSLIGSRIDQLDEGPQTTLKVASVIGQRFSASWLRGIYPQLGRPTRVLAHLDTLVRQELTLMQHLTPEAEYQFKHPLIRDVAYERMSVATRAMLHEATAQFIERSQSDSIDHRLDLLAFHYGRSRNSSKQREYLQRAAEIAQAAYNNDTAVDYYQRLLPLLEEPERIAVMLKLGEVWQLVGKWAEADTLYRNALVLAGRLNDRQAEAQCRYALGMVRYLRGEYDAALTVLTWAKAGFEALGDEPGASAALRTTGHVYARQGNYPEALQCYEQCMDSAIARVDRRAVGQAIADIGDLYFYQGDYSLAMEYYERWLHRVAELGDLRQAGYTLADMGQVYWRLGNPFGALFCFAQQYRIGSEIGDRRLVALACGNLADIYRAHGDQRRAQICAAHQLRISLEIGDRAGVAIAVADLGALELAAGQAATAERLVRLAVAHGRALHIPYELCEFLLVYAEVCMAQRRYAEAAQLNDEAYAIATQVSRRDVQFQAHLHALHLAVALGQQTPAEAVATALALLPRHNDEAEQAALYYAIWQLDPAHDDAQAAAAARYQRLAGRSPSAENRRRVSELSGTPLAEPAALDELPEALRRQMPDLARLLAQAEALPGA